MTLSAWIPSVWLLLVLLVQGTCVGVAEAAPSRPDLSGYLSVPLKKTSHNQLLVAVLVNGHPATFLVDTGAPHVGIEQARVAALGIEPLGANGPQAPTVQTNGRRNPRRGGHRGSITFRHRGVVNQRLQGGLSAFRGN